MPYCHIQMTAVWSEFREQAESAQRQTEKMQRPERKSWKRNDKVGSYTLKSVCSLWSVSQRIGSKEKPQSQTFFHYSPGSIYLCTAEYHWVQSQVQMHEGTSLTHTQPNKQGFCKIPLCLSSIKRHYIACQLDGQGNRQHRVAVVISFKAHRLLHLLSQTETTCTANTGTQDATTDCRRTNCSSSTSCSCTFCPIPFFPMISF